jgi:hypothetical protein
MEILNSEDILLVGHVRIDALRDMHRQENAIICFWYNCLAYFVMNPAKFYPSIGIFTCCCLIFVNSYLIS